MRIRLAASAVAAALALSGCSDRSGDADGGGTIFAALPADPQTLFPLLVNDEASKIVTDLLFERLARVDDNLTVFGDAGFTPALAERWDWASDSLSITFHIDPDARFHDGTPVKASDVAYALRLAKDSTLGSSTTSLIANIDSATVVDSLSVRFWYKRRSPTQFYDAAYQIAPVPEHIYGKVGAAALRTSEVTRTPVGTGRFRFVKWEPGVRLEIVADTANAMGRAKLDRVVFIPGQPPTASAAAILAGELDFFSAFPNDQVATLDSGTVARSIPYRQNGYGFIAMKSTDRKSPSRPHPVLGDIAVRRAIAMGVDRRAMLTNVFGDAALLAHGPFPTGASLSDSTLRNPQYDTTAAKAALDAAGWRPGANGVRTKNGRPLAIELLVPTSSLIRLRYAELIQEQLNRLGFQIEVARATPPQFFPRMASGDFDLIILAQNTDATVTGIQQFWSTSGLPPNGGNFVRYQSPIVDAKLDSAALAATPAEMKRLTSAAFQQIMDDVPAVWLYSSATIAAVNRRIEPAPFGLDGWWKNLADWTIPADKRIDRDRVGLGPATATP